jgi:hypothetical protein
MRHIVFSVLLLAATLARAQEGLYDVPESPGEPQTMVGASWESQYIWRGFDVFGGDSALHVMADMALWGTGFGVGVVGHESVPKEFGDFQRWDGTFYYQSGLLAGEPLATNYRLGYVYYYYPKHNFGQTNDLMEGHIVLSWPNLVPIRGIQPSYAFAYIWPGRSNPWTELENPEFRNNARGTFHIFMLDYAFTIPALMTVLDDHVTKLHAELVYNDGVSPFGTPVNAGLSHAVLGLSTDFAFGAARNLVLTPAVYYQFSFEDSVNPDNEFWAGISLRFAF